MIVRNAVRVAVVGGMVLSALGAGGPAPALLASRSGGTRVERAGTARPVSTGMTLERGDVVVAGQDGAASILVPDAGLVTVAAGTKLAVVDALTAGASGTARTLSAFARGGAMQGFALLGVLDPSARPPSLPTEPAPPWTGADPPRAVALAPRHEPIVSFEPEFFATGGRRPARIALASETLVVWRSGRFDGDGPWTPEGFPRLDPKRRFQWRVEAAVDGAPLTAWMPVRGVDEATLREFASFELDMRDLASTPHAAAADVVRCGVYAHHKVWTSLLAAAVRLRATDPESPLAKRARETAVQGLQLDPGDAEILERLLVPGTAKTPAGA